jgi:hypothetical protein
MRSLRLTAGLAIVAMCSVPSATMAAVRACFPMVSSGPQAATSVRLGQSSALAAWTKAAEAAVKPGSGKPNWRIATNKTLSCGAGADGKLVCTAQAMPCVIEQVPGKLGPSLPPPRPPEPKVIPVPPVPTAPKPINA